MTTRNWIALGLTIVSLGLLWPGLTEPVLTITASINVLGVSREVFRQTQSIWESVRNLHDSGNTFVAGLILFFSITVPGIKAALLAAILFARRHATRRRLFLFVRSVSKWAMADVFVVGVFIAYLAAKATDNLDAVAEFGFYCFASYCLVSNLAFQFLEVPALEAEATLPT
jgi:uncharacterized paraquat-inducible protein A